MGQTLSSSALRDNSFFARARRRIAFAFQGRLRCFDQALALVEGKRGLEIGGPSDVFESWRLPSRVTSWRAPLPIYDRIDVLDNCAFAANTMWAQHSALYHFSSRRPPGKMIIADGSHISPVPDSAYDFVLSSHNLEHFANPVKALNEWKRVTRPHGGLILVLPYHHRTFDRFRAPTPVQHMLQDFADNIGEDDLTHVPEVLRLHDIAMDGTLVTRSHQELRERSLNNLSNRSLHHHVFDEVNSTELLKAIGLEIQAVEFALPYHLFLISRWR